VTITASPEKSGTWNIDSSTGHVTLDLPGGDRYGYDVSADTSTGDIELEFSDSKPYGEQSENHQAIHSNDFSDREVQITMEISTSTGDIQARN